MIIRIQPKQTGKTYDIAMAMKKDKKAICFQPNLMMKLRFCELYNIDKKRVFIPNDLLIGRVRGVKCKVYIDELNAFLMGIIKQDIEYCTYTGEYELNCLPFEIWKIP